MIEQVVRTPKWVKITSLARALEVPVSTLAEVAEQEAEVAQVVREARARIITAHR